jgi:hypothetical protein
MQMGLKRRFQRDMSPAGDERPEHSGNFYVGFTALL